MSLSALLKLVSLFLVLLTPSLGMADSIPVNPDSIPLFYGVLGQNPIYRDAAFKAQQAFMLQVGVTPAYNKITSYVSSSAQNRVSTIVDSSMPFTMKQAATVVGFIYIVGVKKQLNKTFTDPWCPTIVHSFSINSNSGSTGINIKF